MDCDIHAREWISPAFCQWFVYQVSELEGTYDSPVTIRSPALHWEAAPLSKQEQLHLPRRAHIWCCQEINALDFTQHSVFIKLTPSFKFLELQLKVHKTKRIFLVAIWVFLGVKYGKYEIILILLPTDVVFLLSKLKA